MRLTAPQPNTAKEGRVMDRKITPKEALIVLDKFKSGDTFNLEYKMFGREVKIKRRNNGNLGALGGGWIWGYGFEVGRLGTILVTLKDVQIRINPEAK